MPSTPPHPSADKEQVVDGKVVRAELACAVVEMERVHRETKDPALYIQFDAINELVAREFEVRQKKERKK